MSSTAQQPSLSDWETHKTSIRRLFFGGDDSKGEASSYQDILSFLASKGIHASENQLAYRLKQWNFRRKLPVAACRYVAYKVAKRKDEGKKSEVLLSGEKIDERRLQRKSNRSKQVSLVDKYYKAASPTTPEGIDLVVRTPDSPSSAFPISRPFPWCQFQSEYLKYVSSIFSPATERIHGLMASNFSFDRLSTGGGIWLDHSSQNCGPLDIAKHVRHAIPHASNEETMRRAMILVCGEVTSYDFGEVLKIFLFLVSNSFYSCARKDDWDVVKAVLRPAITALNQPLNISWRTSITINAMLEKLFEYSILWTAKGDEESLEVVKWLLKSGQNANQYGRYHASNGGHSYPLLVAISAGRVELTKILLENGANVHGGPGNDDDTPLAAACRVLPFKLSEELVNLLLSYGAPPDKTNDSDYPPALHYAVRNANIAVVELLLEHGANIWTRHVIDLSRTDDYLQHTATALSEAAGFGLTCDTILHNKEETALVLIQILLSKLPQPIESDALITADVLIAAASCGHNAVISFFFSLGVSLDSYNEWYITPLFAAAFYGQYNTCELLLELGASVNHPSEGIPSALHVAAYNDYLKIVTLLAHHKASVISSLDPSSPGHEICNVIFFIGYDDYHDYHTCCTDEAADGHNQELENHHKIPLLSALTNRSTSCASLLIQMGAELSMQALFLILEMNSQSLIIVALGVGANFDAHTYQGLSALQFALSRSEISIVWLLLNNSHLYGGELSQAFKLGNYRLIQALLEKGAVRGPSPFQESFLEAAASCTEKDIVRFALRMEPSEYDSGALCAAVFSACENRKYDIVGTMLQRRPHSRQSESLEATAVSIAVFFCDIHLVQTLTTLLPTGSQCKIPARMGTLYRPGGWFDNLQWICKLRVDARNLRRVPFWRHDEFIAASPLMVAIHCDVKKLITLLLEVGYQPDWMTISYAIFKESKFTATLLGSRMILPSIVAAKMPPPPSYWAVQKDDAVTLRTLLSAGEGSYATPRLGGFMERTTFQLAIERGNDEIINLLLEAGADVNEPPADFQGATALYIAAIKGYFNIAKRLIALGADVDAPGDHLFNTTAIEAAARNGRLELLQLLLNHCNKIKDGWNHELLRAAVGAFFAGHHAIVGVLKEEDGWGPAEEVKFRKMVEHRTLRVDWQTESNGE